MFSRDFDGTQLHIQSGYNYPLDPSPEHKYLLMDSPPAELRRAVRTVSRGETYFPPAIAALLAAAQNAPAPTSRLDVLTPRERDVLLGIARGATNKEMAAKLGISHRTVETHREALMDKLAIRTVAGLTKLVLEEGRLTE